jgi:hypothetical protein
MTNSKKEEEVEHEGHIRKRKQLRSGSKFGHGNYREEEKQGTPYK